MTRSSDSSPAIVLRTSTLGEADLLTVFLTPQFGKVRAAARAARRSRRRFAGGMPTGACGEATFAKKSGLWRLDAFVARLETSSLGRDLERFGYAAYLCELTDVALTEPTPDAELFTSLWHALQRVLEGPVKPAILRSYELALLRALGHAPALELCCVCGARVPRQAGTRVAYDPARGGVVCEAHVRTPTRVPADALALAAHMQESGGWREGSEADLDALDRAPLEVRRAVRDMTVIPLRSLLGRPLRSLAFLQQVAGSSRREDPT